MHTKAPFTPLQTAAWCTSCKGRCCFTSAYHWALGAWRAGTALPQRALSHVLSFLTVDPHHTPLVCSYLGGRLSAYIDEDYLRHGFSLSLAALGTRTLLLALKMAK